MNSHSFEAIGTSWKIDIPTMPSGMSPDDLITKTLRRIDQFDETYSRFRADSLVTRISKEPGTYEFPDDAREMIALYKELYDLTGGSFTPLIGRTMEEAGYDAVYSLVPKTLHAPPVWDEALSYEHPKMKTKMPILLDFGAMGKGRLIDIVGALLEDAGVKEFTIDAGGDVLHKGPEILRIGLEHPEHSDQAIGVAEIRNKAIAASAGNRRTWANFHHIIDPKTLASPRHILATWCVADDAMHADAFATSLFFADADALHAHYEFEHLVVRSDYSIDKSLNFPAEIFTSDDVK